MTTHLKTSAGVLALCLPLFALGQPSGGHPAAGADHAQQLRYRSAFTDYKPWLDTKPADWRAVNDTVLDAARSGGGGHAGAAAAPAASAPAAPAMPKPHHDAHPSHGGAK